MKAKQQYLIENIVRDLVSFVCSDYGMTLKTALSEVYNSDTLAILYDIKTGLYLESSMYVYSMLVQELDKGKFEKEY